MLCLEVDILGAENGSIARREVFLCLGRRH